MVWGGRELECLSWLSYEEPMGKFSTIYDRSRVPLYLQVASVMRQRINSGRWAEGEKISTLEELEEEFGVARVTVRQAIELLRAEDLLRAQQGRGTFVSGRPANNRWLNLATDFDSLVESIRNNVLKRVFIQRDAEPPALVSGEGTPAKAYTFLRSVQFNGGRPFSVVNLHLDQRLFLRDSKRFTRSAALPRIVEMEDVSITHAYQTFTIGVADPETADLLEIGLGEPTADCHLTVIDDSGVAIYVADIHYLKNCFILRNDLLTRGA
jgi:GntR family transcriptional regulator